MTAAVLDKERTEVAGARSLVYSILARVYLEEVTPEFLSSLKNEEIATSLLELGVDLSKSLPDDKSTQADQIDSLAEEYAALFLLPGGLSPHESVRIKGLLCQQPEQEVRGFYKKCGIDYPTDSKVFADHLGTELDFMAFLSDKEASSLKKGEDEEARKWQELQKEFFNSHMKNWMFKYLDDLNTNAYHPFYKDMALLTSNFLKSEEGDLASS